MTLGIASEAALQNASVLWRVPADLDRLAERAAGMVGLTREEFITQVVGSACAIVAMGPPPEQGMLPGLEVKP
jgi:uncharacterized protein (DUF1778 family)